MIWTYDALGSYHFDDGDRIFQIDDLRDPQRDRSFGYDTLDRLTQATGPYAAGFGSVSWHYAYTPIGNLACKSSTSPTACTGPDHRTFSNGGHPYYTPEPAHAPTWLTEPGPSGQTWIAQPGYDYSGNLTSYPSLAGSWTYTYNALSQLESATSVASGDVTRFEYDGGGRLALIEEGTGASASLRHLVYEDFEWAVTDELARIHISIGSTLIATHTESYVQSGGGACGMGAELGLLGPLLFCFGGRGERRRRRRRSAVAAGTAGVFLTSVVVVPVWIAAPPPVGAATPALGVLYYHGDHLGSTTVVTDEVGALVERSVYRPFGEAVPAVTGGATDAPEFGFTSQRYVDSIGIYDYGARWYHPVMARFIQPDALVPDPADPQSFNRYSYVRNSPLTRVDPTGNADGYFDFGAAFNSAYSYLGGLFGGDVGSAQMATQAPGNPFFDGGFGFGVTLGADVEGGLLVGGVAANADVGAMVFADGLSASVEDVVNYGWFASFLDRGGSSDGTRDNAVFGGYGGGGINLVFTTANSVEAMGASLTKQLNLNFGIGVRVLSIHLGITKSQDVVFVYGGPLPAIRTTGYGWGFSYSHTPSTTTTPFGER